MWRTAAARGPAVTNLHAFFPASSDVRSDDSNQSRTDYSSRRCLGGWVCSGAAAETQLCSRGRLRICISLQLMDLSALCVRAYHFHIQSVPAVDSEYVVAGGE